MPKIDEQEILDWLETLPENKLAALPETEIEAITTPPFICECEEWHRSACKGLPFYKEYNGKRYCVLHYPGEEKADDFRIIFEEKKAKRDFDFTGVWFPEEVDFNNFEFQSEADFRSATFSALAYFRYATFSAYADFSGATFSAEAYFYRATFSALADFSFAILKDYVSFNNTYFKKDSSLAFQPSHIEEPKRISFHTVTLRPHWFINTDTRDFEFTNITWTSNFDGKSSNVKLELQALERKLISYLHQLLARTCRQLAVNAEENNRYEEASDFRFMAMEAARLEPGHGWAFWKLRWWYWLASGYGERTGQAALVLVGVWFVFALLYTQVGFELKKTEQIKNEEKTEQIESPVTPNKELGNPLTLGQAVNHSFNVMALQRPEPKGQTFAAKSLVSLETILGPLQAALLALAIRRKFMR